MKRALLIVGGACNNRCLGCPADTPQGGWRERRATRAQVLTALERLARARFQAVTLAGGEPTLRRALPAWVSAARRLGMEVTLRTNGRLLAYQGMAATLVRRGLTAFEVKLPASDPATHRALTRADGLSQTLDGLAAAARVAPVRVRCTLGPANTSPPALEALADAVARRAPRATLVFAVPRDGAASAPPREVADALEAGLARALARGLVAVHEGLPLCLLPDHLAHGEARPSEAEGDGVVATLFADDGALLWDGLPARTESPPEDDGQGALACHDCALEPRCPGTPPGWEGDLRPRPGLRSNSFHYAPAGEPLPWPAGAPCPALGLDTPAFDPARGLFLCRDDTLQWHATASRDFSRAELWRTRARRGQVYLDVSHKAAADDFAQDLAPLTALETCAACPAHPRCPGAYETKVEVEGGDIFHRDDATVREVLATLSGDVLDLGCGEGPYLDTLAHCVADGAVRYWGVDPHAPSVETLRRRWPALRLQVGAAEDLELDPESLDAALVLRSYNHLRDPDRVLGALTRALRPGGTLLLVDNVAFGLVRSPEQVARAEGGPAVFEHYRNATAAQAKARVARVGGAALRLVDERLVGPGTSNQWLLRYERASPPGREGGGTGWNSSHPKRRR